MHNSFFFGKYTVIDTESVAMAALPGTYDAQEITNYIARQFAQAEERIGTIMQAGQAKIEETVEQTNVLLQNASDVNVRVQENIGRTNEARGAIEKMFTGCEEMQKGIAGMQVKTEEAQ